MTGILGRGGTGNDPSVPECPCCYATGGGGHGGFCPNIGRSPDQYTDVLPAGFTHPER